MTSGEILVMVILAIVVGALILAFAWLAVLRDQVWAGRQEVLELRREVIATIQQIARLRRGHELAAPAPASPSRVAIPPLSAPPASASLRAPFDGVSLAVPVAMVETATAPAPMRSMPPGRPHEPFTGELPSTPPSVRRRRAMPAPSTAPEPDVRRGSQPPNSGATTLLPSGEEGELEEATLVMERPTATGPDAPPPTLPSSSMPPRMPTQGAAA